MTSRELKAKKREATKNYKRTIDVYGKIVDEKEAPREILNLIYKLNDEMFGNK